jgi:hypothetical protein
MAKLQNFRTKEKNILKAIERLKTTNDREAVDVFRAKLDAKRK